MNIAPQDMLLVKRFVLLGAKKKEMEEKTTWPSRVHLRFVAQKLSEQETCAIYQLLL